MEKEAVSEAYLELTSCNFSSEQIRVVKTDVRFFFHIPLI